MAQLSGYGAETRDERQERQTREQTYGKAPQGTSETKAKEKR